MYFCDKSQNKNKKPNKILFKFSINFSPKLRNKMKKSIILSVFIVLIGSSLDLRSVINYLKFKTFNFDVNK